MPFDENPGTRADYVKIMERADRGVGQILATLDKHGLSRNTLVIFTNDNGGEWLSRNAPLFNRKFTLWEGGIRVPAMMRWPGRDPGRSRDAAGRHHDGPDRFDPGGRRRSQCPPTRDSTGSISLPLLGRGARRRSADAVLARRKPAASTSARSATATGSC